MKRRRTSGLAPLALAVLAGCAGQPDAPVTPRCPEPPPVAADAATEHEAQGEYYAMPGLDHGLIQSPVNILSQEAETRSHTVELKYDQRGARGIVNKGHTIELEFPKGILVTFDGRTYEVVQTHFHTPSEHLIDGMTYPMEMHIVSMAPSKGENAPPQYLVMGVLFKMGDRSELLDRVIAQVPKETEKEVEVEPLHLIDLFPGGEAGLRKALGDVFHYRGSLTTPPYTETVEWVVFKQPLEAGPEQIASINAIEGDNARHIQMQFGRKIEG